MSTRELLDLAAKAAGIEITWEHGQDFPERVTLFRGHLANYDRWDPLNDDGDALRLAVALQAAKGSSWVICLSIGDNRTACEFHYACGPDSAANVRRAIVIAAAEHGKTLP